MKGLNKISIGFNILLLILLIGLGLKEHYPSRIYHHLKSPETAVTDTPVSYWFNRDQLFEAFPKDSNSIVFIGTSLTQNFELAELFHDANIKNRGIIGDVTPGALQRLKAITDLQPKKIVIELGINDLFIPLSEDSLLHNYQLILEVLKSTCPHAKIYVQSLLPISQTKPFVNVNPSDINTHIRSVNLKLKALAAKNGCSYIEVYSHFEKQGALNDAYTTDGVHINGKGYLLWRDVLLPYVKE